MAAQSLMVTKITGIHLAGPVHLQHVLYQNPCRTIAVITLHGCLVVGSEAEEDSGGR